MFIISFQNNSGGYFIRNKKVNDYVIVEGNSESHAISRLQDFINDYQEYCECCGVRWGNEEVILNEHQNIVYSLKENKDGNCVIHFLNGSSKTTKLKEGYDLVY